MSIPHRVILACDESGAKGYADNDETFPGEVGVFAGILMPAECVADRFPPFQNIAENYKPASGKLHIAELSEDEKQRLRRDIFEAVQNSGLPCFWYGIHVSGLYNSHSIFDDIILKGHENLAEIPRRIKRGSHRSSPPSMHVELFKGLFANIIAFLAERGLQEVDIEIRSDRIDPPTIVKFKKASMELLNFGSKPRVRKMTGFDTTTNRVVSGTISSQVHLPSNLGIGVSVKNLTFNALAGGDGLVLAADVLANSLHHLFKHRPEDQLYRALNRPAAVANHPLARNLNTFRNWGGPDLIGDCLFRHPKDPDRPQS
jgi:hypothetical protein